jgi:putative membrane protein
VRERDGEYHLFLSDVPGAEDGACETPAEGASRCPAPETETAESGGEYNQRRHWRARSAAPDQTIDWEKSMIEWIAHFLVTAALLMLVARFVRGVEVESFGAAFVAALVLGLVNALVRPVMLFLTFPITIVTFGLFLFVVNALVLWMVGSLSPGMKVSGFGPALLGSLLLSLLNVMVGWVFGFAS